MLTLFHCLFFGVNIKLIQHYTHKDGSGTFDMKTIIVNKGYYSLIFMICKFEHVLNSAYTPTVFFVCSCIVNRACRSIPSSHKTSL